MPDDEATAASPPPPDAAVPAFEIPEHAAELGADATAEILPAAGPLRAPLHWLGLFEQATGVILLLALLVMVLIQVGQRYVPNAGIPPTGEIARLTMVWVTLVMSGYLMAHDRHIAIHVVDYVLSVRARGVVQLMASIVVLLTCLGMAYATWSLIATDRGQITAEAQIPLVVVYAIALFGFVSTAIRAVITVVVLDLPVIVGNRGKTA